MARNTKYGTRRNYREEATEQDNNGPNSDGENKGNRGKSN